MFDFLEDLVFTLFLLPITGINILFELLGIHGIDYPTNNENFNISTVEGRPYYSHFMKSFRDPIHDFVCGNITFIFYHRKTKLSVICFILPPLAVFLKRKSGFNMPFISSVLFYFSGLYVLSLIISIYIVFLPDHKGPVSNFDNLSNDINRNQKFVNPVYRDLPLKEIKSIL